MTSVITTSVDKMVFNESLLMSYGPAFPAKVLVATPQSWYSALWSWITLDISHVAITAFAIALLINLIFNEKHQQAKFGIITGLFMMGVSVFAVWINFNAYLGGFFAICSLWLVTQSSRYNKFVNDDDVEEVSDVEETPVIIKPQEPQSVYSGSGSSGSIPTTPGVSLGTGLGFSLR